MTDSVERLYELPESRRNSALRDEDWRFLLPRAAALDADPVRLGFPTGRSLQRASAGLESGEEILCRWRFPRPGGASRARKRLQAAGFDDVSVHWPGPLPSGQAQFWFPVGSDTARDHLIETRARTGPLRLLLPLWRLALRLGALGPLFARGRLAGPAGQDPVSAAVGESGELLLITPGQRSINKVVGLAFDSDGPAAVLKAARVPEAEGGVEREADVLERVARLLPADAAPRLLARGTRAGMAAIVESPVLGRSIMDELSAATFPTLAEQVTARLLELAHCGSGEPGEGWRRRLVEDPVGALARDFGPVLAPGEADAVGGALAGLGELMAVCEHRDCSPWNLVVGPRGIGLHDWESAELEGLPGLDLVYFMANAAFVLDGSLDDGTTLNSYARLLDPGTATGAVAAECFAAYGESLGIGDDDFARLRLLCWVVHCRSDRRHLALESRGEPDPADLARSPFLGLLREELERIAG